MRGYRNTPLYQTEIQRLMNYWKKFEHEDNMLLHVTIGAAMEENISKVPGQWSQLFPHHVQLYAETDNPVRVIIISPNHSFADDKYVDPSFVEQTNETFKWKKSFRKYVSQVYNVQVHIFCTLCPHAEPNRNALHMQHYKKTNIEEHSGFRMAEVKQTKYDVNFVKEYYQTLDIVFENVEKHNGVVTCFSFAVFHYDTDFIRFNNYSMFSELPKLFDTHSNTRILSEWIHDPYNYTLTVYGSLNIITYDPTKDEDTNQLNISMDEKMSIKVY